MTASGMLSQKRAIERRARSLTSSRRRVPVAAGEGVRHVLGEDAHRVHALGRDARCRGPSGNRARSRAGPAARPARAAR